MLKKITQSFLTLLLMMVMGLVNANAKTEKVHATFESPSNTSATWNAADSSFVWKQTSYNQIRNIGLPSGDITKYKKLVVDCTMRQGTSFRILVYKGGSNITLWAKDGVNEFILADTLKVLAPDDYNSYLKECSEICLSGSNAEAAGEVKINDMYLETYNDEGDKAYATFESPSNTSATWNAADSSFVWKQTSYNQIRNIGLPSGDITKYKKLVVDCTMRQGTSFRILVYKGGSNITLWAKDGVNEFILADTLKALAPDDYNAYLKECSEICLSGSNAEAAGEVKINDMYLETYPENESVEIPDIEYEEDPGKPEGDYIDFTEAFPELNPKIGIGEDTHPIVLGNGDVVVGQRTKNVIADLSAYNSMTLVATPGLKMVIYMNHEIEAKQNAGEYSAEDEGKYEFIEVQAGEDGLYTLDLTQYDKQDLNCIATPWDNTNKGTVWYILLEEGDAPVATYAITINEAENGTVSADVEEAAEGDKVTLTITPAEGYELDALTVVAGETDVEVAEDNTFTMPAAAVTVTATFKEIEAALAYTDLTNEMFFQWNAADETAEAIAASNCDYNIGTSTGQVYGLSTVNHDRFADLSAYNTIELTATEGEPRLLFNRIENEGTVFAEVPRDKDKYETVVDNGDGTTTYIIDIAAIVAEYGFAHLHAIKGANWANTTVTEIKLGYTGEKPALPEIVSTYAITIAEAENGSVSADATEAAEGDKVTLTITPAEGYELDALTVVAGETPVEVAEDNTFTMPAAAVTVTATFKEIEAALAYTDLTNELFFHWNAADETAEAIAASNCDYNIGTSTGQVYGLSTVNHDRFADLSAYNTIELTATEGEPRLLFNRIENEGTVFAEVPRDKDKYETVVDNGDGSKTYIIDIAAIVAEYGFAHLHAIKGANWANTTVTEIKLGYTGEKPALPEIVSTYAITIAEAENGSVAADATEAAEGDKVTLTITPAEGYELDALTVVAGETAVEVAEDNTFTMPAAAVTVTATFKEIEAALAYTDLTNELFFHWNAADETAEALEASNCDFNIGTSTGQVYGLSTVNHDRFADLSAYNTIELTATEGEPRLLFNRIENEGTVFAEVPRDKDKYETVVDNGDGSKTYIIDIAAIVAEYGFAHLHAIKGANWANTTVTEIKLGYAGEKPALPIPTAIEGVETAEDAVKDGKYFINGQIVIVKNGVKYNAAGVAIK